MIISLIVAVSNNLCIGKDNGLLWNLPADMAYFKKITGNGIVLMGRKTYLSIPEKFRPLPNRFNLVVSKDASFVDKINHLNHANLLAFDNLKTAIEAAKKKSYPELFVIGGAEIYKQTIDIADKLYVTHVDCDIEGDAFFPNIETSKWLEVSSEDHSKDEKNIFNFKFITYLKK